MFFVLVASTNLEASTSRDYVLLREKPSVTANSFKFAASSSLTSIYTILWGHNLQTKNKSINVCIFDVSLDPSKTILQKSKCQETVNWFDRGAIVGTPSVVINFTTPAIINPKKIVNKIEENGCSAMRSFTQGTLCLIEDSLYFVRSGEGGIFYSVNLREALKLQSNENNRYESSMAHLFRFQLSDDGKHILLFRSPYSEWDDNLPSIKNNQYFSLSVEKSEIREFTLALTSSRDFIEAIHEKNGEQIALLTKVDQSGDELSQYLLGFPRVTFSDYQFVRDYSTITNSVLTINLLNEDGKRVFVFEEMDLEGNIKMTKLNWIRF